MSSIDDDPEISRIFAEKTDRRFQRDFGRFMGNNRREEGRERMLRRFSQQKESCGKSKTDQMALKLIEANEQIAKLQRQLTAREEELEGARRAESAANDRAAEAQREANKWRTGADRDARRSSLSSGRRISDFVIPDKLLLDDYKKALSKYLTWHKFSSQQLQIMKTLLEECGGWTETNRYKIFFSYRDIGMEEVQHEKVHELATGSTLGTYVGAIEDVENISATVARPKFQTVTTQTDEDESTSLGSNSQSQQSSDQQLNSGFSTVVGSLSAQELRLIDCERDIERLEILCAQQSEQLIILSERAKHVELLEEQKNDLQMQLGIMRRHNDQLIRDHEQLKSAFGGGAISRNSLEELVRGSSFLKEKNKELEANLQQMEAKLNERSVNEARRIAQLFKRKYEAELQELRSKLQIYEPLHSSDSTRIWRFAAGNPLDEAHEDLMIREVAKAATSGEAPSNSLKKRKLDNSAISSDNATKRLHLDAEGRDELLDDEETFVSASEHDLLVQIRALKSRLENQEKESKETLAEYRAMVSLLSGYDVRLAEEGFCEVENVLSKNCVFLFQKHDQQPPTVDLLDSDSAQRWKDIIANYLVRYNSVPAFLSAVTISLIESPPEDTVSPLQSQQFDSEEPNNNTTEPY